MADMDTDDPSGGRKTNALIYEMVAGVSKQIESLDRLTQAEFKAMQRQIDSVTGLPIVVNGLIEKVKQIDEDVQNIKADEQRRRDYRIGPLMLNLIGGSSLIVAVVALAVSHG